MCRIFHTIRKQLAPRDLPLAFAEPCPVSLVVFAHAAVATHAFLVFRPFAVLGGQGAAAGVA